MVEKTGLLENSLRCVSLIFCQCWARMFWSKIQCVYVSVGTTEIADAAYQVWFFHTSFANVIAVICQE